MSTYPKADTRGTDDNRSRRKEIWKYPVPLSGGPVDILMPFGAEIVHVDVQSPELVVFWAIVDTGDGSAGVDMETRYFYVVGTGHPIPFRFKYLGTAVVHGLPLVWHLLEVFDIERETQ